MASIDIAMQSTSEEILEKIEKTVEPIKRYSYSSVATTTATFLEVTGKGRFYYGKIDGSAVKTPGATINIFVDGKQIISGNLKGNSNGMSVLLPIGNAEYSQISYNGTSFECYYPFFTTAMAIKGSWHEMCPLTADSSYTFSSSGGTSGNNNEYWFYIDRYIEFDESFKVELTDNSGAKVFTAWLCYSLDEE